MISSNFFTTVFIFLGLHGLTYPYDHFELENPTESDDPRLTAPWVASIFKRNEDEQWVYHCGGTLIKSFVVMTAASCVSAAMEDNNDILYHTNYTNLMVIAGLREVTKDYLPMPDEYTQFAQVSLIREHKPPKSHRHNSSVHSQIYESPANLAAILLSQEFNFTDYVQPVHVSKAAIAIWEANILQEAVATIAGFNINPLVKSDKGYEFQSTTLEISISLDCVQGYTQHTSYFNVACGYLPGETTKSIPCFMEGSGLIGYINEIGYIGPSIPYLMGIYTSNSATLHINEIRDPYPLSRVEKNTQCTHTDVIFFTRLGEYFRWAKSHSLCGANMLQCQSSGECYKPNQICDGVANCDDKSDESKEVCKNQKTCTDKEFKCEYGVCIDEKKFCNGNLDCVDGSDESDEEKCREEAIKRKTMCQPIPESKGVSTKCTFRGSLISNCNVKKVPPGTTAQQSCDPYYKGDVKPSIMCKLDGGWSNSFLKCTPECGISESPKTEFSAGGKSVEKHGEWPWYAAIYRAEKHRTGTETFWCGASLISTTEILTAAHCVKNDDNTDISKEELRVVLGKIKRSYDDDEDGLVQKIPIRSIIAHKAYIPSSFEADIALIILKRPVNITSSVRPVCLPADESMTTRQLDNLMGIVAGFGIDEKNIQPPVLKAVELSYLAPKACEKELKKQGEFRFSWICGGHPQGEQAVCKGDSGGGFVFASQDPYGDHRYSIQGIVSHGPTRTTACNKDSPEIFTKVTAFLPWINRVLQDPVGPMIDEWYQINLKTNGLLTWSRENASSVNTYRVQIVHGILRQDYEKGRRLYDDSLWKFEKSEDDPEFYTLVNKNRLNAVLTWAGNSTYGKNVVLIDKKANFEEYLRGGEKRDDVLWKLKVDMEPSKSESDYTYFRIYNKRFSDFAGKSLGAGILTNTEEKEEGRNYVQIYSNKNAREEQKSDGDYLWSLTSSVPDDNGIPETNLFTGIWYQINLKSGGLLTRSYANSKPNNKGGYHVQIIRGDLSNDFSPGGKFFNDTLWMITKVNKEGFYALVNKNLTNAAVTWDGNAPKGKWMVLKDGKANADDDNQFWKINLEDGSDYYNIFNAQENFKKNGVVTYANFGGKTYVKIITKGNFNDEWKRHPDYLWSFTPVLKTEI